VHTVKGPLQHVAISFHIKIKYIVRCDQFLQLKVNNNMLRSVLTINGQLQHIAISSTRLRSILTIKGQLQHVTVSSDI
jgi:hypothetical protein